MSGTALDFTSAVAWFLFASLIVVGVALYVMKADERKGFIQGVVAAVRRAFEETARQRRALEPFRAALKARTSRLIVTPAVVALNVTLFVFMLFGKGALGDPATLLAWGANFGPRTTNGEWWRLATTMFVHAGLLHLLINVAGLVQCGLVVERLVGQLTFAVVYLAAGTFASLVSVSAHPLAVTAGASGAIFGVYGLLFALMIPTLLHRSSIVIPLMALKRIGPAAALFILYNYDVLIGGAEGQADLAGFIVGFIGGCILSVWASDGIPPTRRLATVAALAAAIAVASAVPLRGVFDARPELERVLALEVQTAGAYQKEVDRFKSGRSQVEKLTQLIEKSILPDLQAARIRMKALAKAPADQQPLVESAEEYLHLREQSWSLRADGLRKSNLATLREAEQTERTSLEALQRVKVDDSASSER